MNGAIMGWSLFYLGMVVGVDAIFISFSFTGYLSKLRIMSSIFSPESVLGVIVRACCLKRTVRYSARPLFRRRLFVPFAHAYAKVKHT